MAAENHNENQAVARVKLVRRHAVSAFRHFQTALQKLGLLDTVTSVQVNGESLRDRACEGVQGLCGTIMPSWRAEFFEHALRAFLALHTQMVGLKHSIDGDSKAPMMAPVQKVLKALNKNCEPKRKLAAFKEMYLRTIRATPGEEAYILTALGLEVSSEPMPPLEPMV